MSTYNDASLILYPSGYKASKLYSLKPTDGTGDLDVVRATGATRVNSDGLIEKVRTNLLLQSEAFDNASWTKTDVSITANTTANPLNGALTADTITLTGATSQKFIAQSLTQNGLFTQSAYLKAGTHQFVQFLVGGDVSRFAAFDLVNGTSSVTGGVATITAVANGFYRCTFSYTTAIGTNMTIIAVDSLAAPRADSTASTGTFIAFGCQLETGDIATDYIPTTTTAVSVGMTANVPRLDYTGGGCPKLLLEPQRTNVCLWSEQINNAGWGLTNAPTITTNIATAPDGYGGADGIQDTTGGTFKRIRQSTSVSANSTNTASVFVKKETTQTNFAGLSLTYTGGTTKFAYGIINPINGTIVVSSDSVIGATSTKVEDYGDWWRFSLTATDNGSNTNLEIAYYATISSNGTSTGVGAGSVRTVWGFQLELGASYVSSYIPTLAAAVTRGADACSKTGISSLIGQTEGTLFADVQLNVKPESGSPVAGVVTLNNNVNHLQNAIILGVERLSQGTNKVYCFVQVGNVTQAALFGSNITDGSYKIAFAYKANDFALYVNGAQVATDTSGSVPTTSELLIGKRFQSDSVVIADSINQAILFPTRLTNTQLAELTTL